MPTIAAINGHAFGWGIEIGARSATARAPASRVPRSPHGAELAPHHARRACPSTGFEQDPSVPQGPSSASSGHDLHHMGLVASGNLLGRGGQSTIFPIEGERTLQRSLSEEPGPP